MHPNQIVAHFYGHRPAKRCLAADADALARGAAQFDQFVADFTFSQAEYDSQASRPQLVEGQCFVFQLLIASGAKFTPPRPYTEIYLEKF